LFDSNTGVESSLKNIARSQISKLRAHKRAALPGLYVLKVDNSEKTIIDFECDAVL
jgi:hypothetical protein